MFEIDGRLPAGVHNQLEALVKPARTPVAAAEQIVGCFCVIVKMPVVEAERKKCVID